MLVRLLYASRADAVTPEVIDAILAQSRAHNPALGITGILCHGGNVFMQVIEGGRDTVNRLYNAIVRDGRHHDVMVLHYEEITERRFSGWTMGQVNLARINPSIVLKYSDRPTLDPFAVSGRASLAMLEELIATASIVGRTA
ncbi:MAG: hypothetical protein RLZZ373_1616 [Pseudomonadota bacterium]|jgi:hypothetical protein